MRAPKDGTSIPPAGHAGLSPDAGQQLSVRAREAVNRWVQAQLAATWSDDDDGALRGALRAAATTLCAEARDTDPLRAERLVIALHAAWPTLSAVRTAAPPDRRGELLAQLVAACIAAFYEPATRVS